jgi:signal transduction histidine kinase
VGSSVVENAFTLPVEGLMLRITLQGHSRDSEAWRRLLAPRGTRALLADDLEADRAAEPTMAIIFAEKTEVEGVAAAATGEGAPPMVLIVGEKDQEHPLTQSIRDLVEAKEVLQTTFDALLDPVMVVDLAGRVTRANLALATALGRPMTEIRCAPYSELLGEAEGPRGDPIARSLATGAAERNEMRFSRLPRVHQITTSPLLDDEGRLRGLVVLLRDVTAEREEREQTVQASRLAAVAALAAGVAHEINTPLASMSLRAESLLRSSKDPVLMAHESFRNFPRYLQGIDDEIQRCRRIVEALVHFSRRGRSAEVDKDLSVIARAVAAFVEESSALPSVRSSPREDLP